MHKSFFILLFAFIPAITFSQNAKMKQLFKNHEKSPGIHYSHGNSNSEMDLGMGSDIEKLLNNVNEFYILKSDENNSSTKKFQSKLQKLIEKGNYENLMNINSDGEFSIYAKRNDKDEPTEVIIINTSDEDSFYFWATM